MTDTERYIKQLARLDEARRQLTLVNTVQDAKEIRDRAKVLTDYARAAGLSLEVMNLGAEIKLRMERKAGELLKEQDKNKGAQGQLAGRDSSGDLRLVQPEDKAPKLADLGINRNQSSRWQRIADIPDEAFDSFIETSKEAKEEITTARALTLLKELAKTLRRAKVMTEAVEVGPVLPGMILFGAMQEKLSVIHDASIDLVLTDPPYGLGQTADIQIDGRENLSKPAGEWDDLDAEAEFPEWLAPIRRVIRPDGSLYIFVSDKQAGALRRALESFGFIVRGHLVWWKTNPPPSVRKRTYVSACEHIVYATAGDSYTFNWQNDRDMQNVIEHPICMGNERLDHPTQKPVGVLKRFISVSSNAGGVVLDPFAGVGSTGAAAADLDRQYILVEKNEYYYRQACLRLRDTVRPAAKAF